MEGKANYGIKDRIWYSKGKQMILNCSEKDYQNDVTAMLCHNDGDEQKG